MNKAAFCILALAPSLIGCIKSEEPNMEVDILNVSTSHEGVLNIVQQGNIIEVYMSPGSDMTGMSLDFVISDGAVIYPDPVEVNDYTSPRVFTVTSEDGEWTRDYTVNVVYNELPDRFDFEHWTQPEKMKFMIPVEQTGMAAGAGDMHIWASGNEPYNFLTGKYDDYTAFPTQPTTQSHAGQYAAKLVTKTTPELSKPIAAGSLFIGQFDASLLEPRESTMFGLPYYKKPLSLKGWYHYRSGGATQYSGVPDQCKIQAVLYKTDSQLRHLNGFTLKTSPNVVARAELSSSDTPADGYVEFEMPFVYTQDINMADIKAGGYNIALIFSSSLNGDVYDGAPGSTLLIDDVEIISEK